MKRFQSKQHLSYVRGLRCAIPTYGCQGRTEAHHLMRPWDGGRGMGMKALDTNVIPLCQLHHRELHKRGDEISFFEEMGYNRDYGKALSRRLWESSPVQRDSVL